jgi:hypothetical protein
MGGDADMLGMPPNADAIWARAGWLPDGAVSRLGKGRRDMAMVPEVEGSADGAGRLSTFHADS